MSCLAVDELLDAAMAAARGVQYHRCHECPTVPTEVFDVLVTAMRVVWLELDYTNQHRANSPEIFDHVVRIASTLGAIPGTHTCPGERVPDEAYTTLVQVLKMALDVLPSRVA